MKPHLRKIMTAGGPLYSCSLKGTKTKYDVTAWGAYTKWTWQSRQADMFV